MDSRDSLALIWVAIAIASAVVEVFSLDLIFLMVAGGAALAAVAALFTGSVTATMLLFAISSVLLLLGARPPLRRYMQRSVPAEAMNAEALVGRTAEVIATVDHTGGRVKLAGEVWTARLESSELSVAVGQLVVVVRIDGATAVVRYQGGRPALPEVEPPGD